MTAVERAPSAGVEARLDAILGRLDAMSAELADSRREAEKWRELSFELMPIARQALDDVGRELARLEPEFSMAELRAFAEDLARALPQLRSSLVMLTALSELGGEIGRILGPAMDMVAGRLDVLEKKGYADFAEGALGVVDRIVTSFSREDVDALGDNIVLILNTVKEMTQPEVMGMLRRTVGVVRADHGGGPVEPPSLLHVLGEMRDPQVRMGLQRVLDMLRSAAPSAGEQGGGSTQP